MEPQPLYKYFAYGMSIRSEVCLPELIGSDLGIDVEIAFDSVPASELDTILADAVVFNRPGCVVKVTPQAVHYRWEGIGSALITNGSRVILNTAAGIDRSDMAPFVTGAIFGNLLDQRGHLVLHGSAVAVNGKGAAFVGEKGAGKSTFALSLQNRGLRLLTDDLVPLVFQETEVLTIPGFPRIKLWEDSVLSAGLDPDETPKINRFVEKRSYTCPDDFSLERVPLERIYVLAEDPDVTIEPLDSGQAFIELTKHTYLNRYWRASGRYEEHFRDCEALVKRIAVFKLRRPHNYEMLPSIASTVLEHLDQSG